MQMAVIEAARNLVGLKDASSTEFGPCDNPVVGLLTEWARGDAIERRDGDTDMGGTMRLGAYPARLLDGSKVAQIYGSTEIHERHRHRYEVNANFRRCLEDVGMVFSGRSEEHTSELQSLMRISYAVFCLKKKKNNI